MGFRDNMETPQSIRPYVEVARYVFSTLICTFAVFIISYGVLAGQSGFSKVFPRIPNWIAFLITIACFAFLAIIEGLQASILALQRHSGEIFREHYPKAYEAHQLISGKQIKNTSKFLIGRQVQVIFTVFFLALLTSFPGMVNFPFTNAPMPAWFRSVFIEQGILSAIFVACSSQLVPQLIATKFPVQFMDLRVCKLVIEIAIWIDNIGIAHFSWVLCRFFAKVFRMDLEVTKNIQKGEKYDDVLFLDGDDWDDSPLSVRKVATFAWKYARYFLSGLLTIFSIFLVVYGAINGQAQFSATFGGAPGWIGFLLLLFVECWLALLEGSQVCIIDLSKHSTEFYEVKYPRAAALQSVCNREATVSRYLIGRQLGTIFMVFLASNTTTLNGMEYFPFTNTAFPEWFRTFVLSTGLLGGFVTVVFGQIFPQLMAASYPVQVMNLIGLKIVVWVCWILEFIGLCHTSWLLYWLTAKGLRLDSGVNKEIRECIVIEDIAAASEDYWLFNPRGLPKGNRRNFVLPHKMANKLMEDGIRVPFFLFPPDHSNHVPPHVVAVELMLLLGETEVREKARSVLYNKDLLSAQGRDSPASRFSLESVSCDYTFSE